MRPEQRLANARSAIARDAAERGIAPEEMIEFLYTQAVAYHCANEDLVGALLLCAADRNRIAQVRRDVEHWIQQARLQTGVPQ